MSELLVMRHAKSDWDAPHSSDHERPLANRGVRSARIVGRFLGAGDRAPDLVISSTATRAIRTAMLAAEVGNWGSDIVQDGRLYGGGHGDVLQAVRDHGGDVDRVMVVGHQPTWSGLVALLTGARVEMKTASVAGIEFHNRSMSAIEPGKGVLQYLLQPRMLFGSEWDGG